MTPTTVTCFLMPSLTGFFPVPSHFPTPTPTIASWDYLPNIPLATKPSPGTLLEGGQPEAHLLSLNSTA